MHARVVLRSFETKGAGNLTAAADDGNTTCYSDDCCSLIFNRPPRQRPTFKAFHPCKPHPRAAPVPVFQIPSLRFEQAGTKILISRPAEFGFEPVHIDRAAPIMAVSVGDKCNETLIWRRRGLHLIQQGADLPNDINAVLPVPPADIMFPANLTMLKK